MSALPRNPWSPLRPAPGPSSLLDRAKILGAHFVGCSRGWRIGRNAVPHPIKETPPVRKFKVRARQGQNFKSMADLEPYSYLRQRRSWLNILICQPAISDDAIRLITRSYFVGPCTIP